MLATFNRAKRLVPENRGTDKTAILLADGRHNERTVEPVENPRSDGMVQCIDQGWD